VSAAEAGGPAQEVKLSELDSAVWSVYGPAGCEVLAGLIIDRVKSTMTAISSTLGQRPLPRLPRGISLDDLDLEARTRNCLSQIGLEDVSEGFKRMTVADVAGIRNFGARCVVDLLTSLESFDMRVINQPWKRDQRVTDVFEYELATLVGMAGTNAIRSDDPRFGRLVARVARIGQVEPRNKTLRRVIKSLRSNTYTQKEYVELVSVLQQIRETLDRACEMRLEEELMDIIPRDGTIRDRELLWLRHGWDGAEGRTLQTIADRFDLTRERVRQICDKLESSLASTGAFTPILDRCVALVLSRVPVTSNWLPGMLWEQELTDNAFDAHSFLDAVRCLKKSDELVLQTLESTEFLVRKASSHLIGIIASDGRDAIRHWGAVNVDYISVRVAKRVQDKVERRVVAHVLQEMEGFEWLDRAGGWFWLTKVQPNRLVNQIVKVMSVARVLDIHELRSGVSRHQRTKGLAPPDRILLQLCRSLGYGVEGEVITAPVDLDWRALLGSAEQILVSVLKERGGEMARDELEAACLSRGMKLSTFQTYLDYSPFVKKCEDGRFCLRGRPATREPA
jgi:hypothetical protein